MQDLRERTTQPSPKERQIHRIIQQYRIRKIQKQWAILRWAPLFQSKWFESIFKQIDRVPPAPARKNLQQLWNAYRGDLHPGEAPPELIIELVTLLYGEKIVVEVDVQNMLSRNYWRGSDGSETGTGMESFQDKTLKELARLLPSYEP